jgi:hypothetical protein
LEAGVILSSYFSGSEDGRKNEPTIRYDGRADLGAAVDSDAANTLRNPGLHFSNFLKNFNEHFGSLFADGDRVARRLHG